VNLREVGRLRGRVVTGVIGEGGSGGALGIAVASAVLMFENSVYSVISPEGCAAILWRDRARAADAAVALKLTAADLAGLGVIDGVLPEPVGGAHRDPAAAAATLKAELIERLDALAALDGDELVERRMRKFRDMGVYERSTS